jgi:hypothetical protein
MGNLSNDGEKLINPKKRSSQFADKDCDERKEDDSPLEINKGTAQINLIKIHQEESDAELSPIDKKSHSQFPFLQSTLRPYTPIEVKLNGKVTEHRFSLNPDALKKRVLTHLSENRTFSPDHPRKTCILHTEENSQLPRLERNASESSRLRVNRCSERSHKPCRPTKGTNFQAGQLVHVVESSSDHFDASTRRLQSNRLKIGEFDKRIQKMKLELESMRRSCL